LTDVSEALTASIIIAISGLLSEISGSHGGEYEYGCLLGSCAALTDVSEVLTASIIRASSSETSVNFYETAGLNITEDSHPQMSYHFKVLRLHKYYYYYYYYYYYGSLISLVLRTPEERRVQLGYVSAFPYTAMPFYCKQDRVS
jgi:hypothetical protein